MVPLHCLAQALVVLGVQGCRPEHHLLHKLSFALQTHNPGVFDKHKASWQQNGGVGDRHTAVPHLQRTVVKHLQESGLLRPTIQVAMICCCVHLRDIKNLIANEQLQRPIRPSHKPGRSSLNSVEAKWHMNIIKPQAKAEKPSSEFEGIVMGVTSNCSSLW